MLTELNMLHGNFNGMRREFLSSDWYNGLRPTISYSPTHKVTEENRAKLHDKNKFCLNQEEYILVQRQQC